MRRVPLIPPGHVGIVDPPPVPLYDPQTCDQHGPTVTATWRSGDRCPRCPLCASYENERRLREALESAAYALTRIASGDCSPSYAVNLARDARKALEEDHA